MKSRTYWKEIASFKDEIARAVPLAELRELHRKRPGLHLAYTARQFAIIGLCSWGLIRLDDPLLWAPLLILQGFTFFNMTTLLHEVVHNSIFMAPKPAFERALGLLYAITSSISASQFTRWHLDHHDNLGSYEDDPKRHWLSPKRNARWYKLLYCTPVLIPLYFRAAANESASYESALRARIARERIATVLIQASVGAMLWTFAGTGAMLRVWLIPYLFVFPVAFTLNRLGQHYNIDPSNPMKWSTLMKPSRVWDFLFLYSNYHLEHHYFPRVPFYNLRRVHMRLRPLYERIGLKQHTYREIAWQWFVLNKKPHTNWENAAAQTPTGPGSSTGDRELSAAKTPSAETSRVAARVAVH